MNRTSITVHKETKNRLVKVRGRMEQADGKRRTIEDVINELIDYYETYCTEDL